MQYLVIKLLGVTVEEVTFTYSGLTTNFIVNAENNIFFNSFLIFLRLFISISFLELGILLLSKFPMGVYRFVTITSILSLVGYLIITFFYGTISTLVLSNSISSFSNLIELWGVEGNKSFALIFFLLIIFVGYLQLVQKRVMQYISNTE